MASVLSDDIGYVKLILLLVKGGTFLVKKHILRLTKQNKIDVYLKNNKRYITKGMQKKIISEKHMDILFPGQSEPTNLECWDISLSSYILLNLFGAQLLGEEKSAIEELRDKRNTLAHPASTTLTEGQFLREWTRLTMTLFQLRRELSKAEQDEYDDVVDKISTINDFNVATNELKLFEESDEFVHIIMEKLKSLEHKLEDFRRSYDQREKERQQEMEKMMKRLKMLEDKMEIHQEMKVKLDVSASTPEIKETAETELLNAAKSCDSSKEDTNVGNDQPVAKVMSAYNDLVSDMEGHGVNITKVEKGSILITVRCPTVLTLKNAIQYFEDRMYEERLRELEKVLSETVENPIELKMSIVLETVYLALEQIEKDNENKSVLLTLQCRGYEGVRNALEFFGNRASTNALNSLSEALSESVGEQIELHSTIGIQQLTKDITQLEQQIVDSNPFTEQLEDLKRSDDQDKKETQQGRDQVKQEMEKIKKRLKTLDDKMEMHQEMKVKMDVSASTPEIKEASEAKLLNAAKSCDSSKEDTNVGNDQPIEKVMTAYNDFVSDMEGHGVHITTVEKGSILITFRCPTVLTLKNVIQYFVDRMYEERLRELEKVLSETVDNPIKLNMSMVLETVHLALEQMATQTPCGEPTLSITPPDCQTLTEIPSDVSTFTEIPSDVSTLGEAPSKHTTPCENLPDEPKHIITRGEQELTELQPVDSTFKTRQKKSTVKHEISTAFACPTVACGEHAVIIGTWGTRQRLVETHLLSECLELKTRRATLHEIESCYPADLINKISFRRVDRTHPLQYNELPCGCIKVVQMTDTPSIMYIPVNYVAAAGCMVDMAYRVGTGELKNGLVLLPPSKSDPYLCSGKAKTGTMAHKDDEYHKEHTSSSFHG